MSKLNPTVCVFPHLGKKQREVLLHMLEGHYIERVMSMGQQPFIRLTNGKRSRDFYRADTLYSIIDRFGKYFTETSAPRSTGVMETMWRFRPDLICEETKLLLK